MAELEAAAKLNHDSSKARGRLVLFIFLLLIIPLVIVKRYCTLKVFFFCLREMQRSLRLLFLPKKDVSLFKKQLFPLNDPSTPGEDN